MASSKYSLSNSDKGGDFDGYYTAIGTWESAVDGTTGSGELAELVIYAEVGDVGPVTMYSWTTGALSKITVNHGDEHNGIYDSGAYGSGRWYLFTDTVVEDIELQDGYFTNTDGATGAITRRCAVYDSSDTSYAPYYRIGGAEFCSSDGTVNSKDGFYLLTSHAYNCVSVRAAGRGFIGPSMVTINCVAFGNTGVDFDQLATGSGNNASEDLTGDDEGSNCITEIESSIFESYINSDFHLASDSTTVSGEGLNLHTSTDLPAGQTDIDGNEWPASGGAAWDMGFDYYVSGVIPDPDPLNAGLALGPTEYTQGSMYLGGTEIETMFLGGINITQQYVTDENGAYLIDENNNYITYGD